MNRSTTPHTSSTPPPCPEVFVKSAPLTPFHNHDSFLHVLAWSLQRYFRPFFLFSFFHVLSEMIKYIAEVPNQTQKVVQGNPASSSPTCWHGLVTVTPLPSVFCLQVDSCQEWNQKVSLFRHFMSNPPQHHHRPLECVIMYVGTSGLAAQAGIVLSFVIGPKPSSPPTSNPD